MRVKPIFFALSVVALAGSGCGQGPRPDQTLGVETGAASYYASKFHGRTTASGEVYDETALTAAHRTLPFGTRVRVTHLATGKEVVVRINDRGPFIKGRIIDLSRRGARELNMLREGVARVRVEVLR